MKIFNKLLYISNKIDRDISLRARKSNFPNSLYIGYNNIDSMIEGVYFIFVFVRIKNIKFYNININNNEIYETLINTIIITRENFSNSIILE